MLEQTILAALTAFVVFLWLQVRDLKDKHEDKP